MTLADSVPISPLWIGAALVLMGLISVGMGIFVYRRQQAASIRAFAALLLSVAIYSFGYGLELWNDSLAGKLVCLKIQYIGIAAIPAFWNLMILQYAGKEKWLTRNVRMALFVIPVLTLALHYTSAYHPLHYNVQGLAANGPFLNVEFRAGPGYWMYVAYMNLSLLFGNLMLFHYWFQSATLYRHQVEIMIAGSLCPWLGHIVYLTGYSPWGLDLAPLTFFVSLLLLGWGLCGFRLFTLAPIAREVVFDVISDAILVLDVQNQLVDYNEPASRLFSTLSPKALGMPAGEILREAPEILEYAASGARQSRQVRRRVGKRQYWYQVRLSPVLGKAGQVLGRILVLQDITHQQALMENLRVMATIDGLTGICNRNHFMRLCLAEIRRARQRKEPVSLVLIDLDHFKQINDQYGHKTGDLVLKAFAATIAGELRKSDLLGRYGGEEFTVFLPDTSETMALQAAERMRLAVEAGDILIEQERIRITASFGVVSVQDLREDDFDGLLRKADQALYAAKNAGRNSVVLLPETSGTPEMP